MPSPLFTRHPILLEDRWLIVINKPAGVLSHPNSPGPAGARCAFEGRYDFGERRFDAPGGPVWLIHRLDQDTSGVLLAAKSGEVAADCRAFFEGKEVRKTYLTLVVGIPRPPSGVWRDHLEKRHGRGMVRSAVVRGRSPNAELRYHLQSGFEMFPSSVERRTSSKAGPFSFLEIVLLTGRTHQIRVQAAARGHPVAGDRVYGDFQLNRCLRQAAGLRRLFLHAAGLGFRHPATGHLLAVGALLPPDLEECLAALGGLKKPQIFFEHFKKKVVIKA